MQTIGLLHIVAFRSAKVAFVLRSFAERKATLLDKSMSNFDFLPSWFNGKWNLNRVLEVESHPLEQP